MIFARKFNKIPEFDMILPENARILHNNCPKNIFPNFWGHVPPCPRLLRQCNNVTFLCSIFKCMPVRNA